MERIELIEKRIELLSKQVSMIAEGVLGMKENGDNNLGILMKSIISMNQEISLLKNNIQMLADNHVKGIEVLDEVIKKSNKITQSLCEEYIIQISKLTGVSQDKIGESLLARISNPTSSSNLFVVRDKPQNS